MFVLGVNSLSLEFQVWGINVQRKEKRSPDICRVLTLGGLARKQSSHEVGEQTKNKGKKITCQC